MPSGQLDCFLMMMRKRFVLREGGTLNGDTESLCIFLVASWCLLVVLRVPQLQDTHGAYVDKVCLDRKRLIQGVDYTIQG